MTGAVSQIDFHLHTLNVIGGVVFFGAIWAHMPTLAWYTAAVGAVWYTSLAVREMIRNIKDLRAWWKSWITKSRLP